MPELPAVILANYCYSYMFYNCTNLTETTELPAFNLAKYCYSNMFSNCSNLRIAPELPASVLTEGCYLNMFTNCTKLNDAPFLLAPTLVTSCYSGMFKNCTKLNFIYVNFNEWVNDCTTDWCLNTNNDGLFIKPEKLPTIKTIHNIPNNWFITNI